MKSDEVTNPYNVRNCHLLLLAIVVLGVFGNSLLNGFVWDDNGYIVGNRVYQEFDLHKMFFSLGNRKEYLPLRDITYAIDYAVWGEHAAGFHLTNILLYLANVVTVYYLALRINVQAFGSQPNSCADSRLTALFTALLFAVHPIHNESVNFIICRNVLVSGLFFFLSSYFYLLFLEKCDEDQNDRYIFYSGALVLFICALMSKATTITLPLVLFLFTALAERQQLLSRRNIFRLAPFFALSLVFYFLFKEVGLKSKVIDDRLLGFDFANIVSKAAVALQIPFFYLGKLFYPGNFTAEYSTEFAKSLAAPASLAALSCVGIIIVFTVAVRKRYVVLSYGLGWFAASLLPVLNFFSTNPTVADRYAYIPSFGLLYLAAAIPFFLLKRIRRSYLLYLGSSVVICFGIISVIRNTYWKNDNILWTETLNNDPKQVKSYYILGNMYFVERNYEKAFDLFAKARGLVTDEDYYDLYMGKLLESRGDLSASIKAYQTFLLQSPENIEALFRLGNLYYKSGDYEHAIEYYNKTIASGKFDQQNLKVDAERKLRVSMASIATQLDAMRQGVAADPQNLSLRAELALKLDTLYLNDEALANYLYIVKTGMRDWRLYFNIANIFNRQKKYEESARYYEKSNELNPTYIETLNNLGCTYRKIKLYEKAISAFEKAIAIDRNVASVPFNLALTYLDIKDSKKALHYFEYTNERFPVLANRVSPYIKYLHERL